MTTPPLERAALYRAVWRWHFYAALFVLPMMLVLSLSGALFLFKPQIERWEERAFQNLPAAGAAAPSAQVAAARAAVPGSQFAFYRLPEWAGDAAMVHLRVPAGGMSDVFVSPQGRVVGRINPESRIIAFDRKIHGQLLLGRQGSWLVELAASWAIVMIATGLYLWWPRGRGPAGVILPRLRHGGRAFWRDLHAVTGFWVSALALVLLFTGLPWADAWGSAFKAVRHEMGWMQGPQDWTIGGKPADGDEAHADHDHAAMAAAMRALPGMAAMHHHHSGAGAGTGFDPALLDTMVGHARAEQLAFPAIVVPPGAPAGEGGQGRPAKGWVVKSDAQNRPLRVTLRYDGLTGAFRSREGLADKHPIDKVLAYGTAWHEGQLFGLFNQLVGLATAAMLITLVVSGTVMWWRRKPEGVLGAPPRFSQSARLQGIGAWALLAFLLLWLPLFTLSLLLILALDRLLLSRPPALADWLGRRARHQRQT